MAPSLHWASMNLLMPVNARKATWQTIHPKNLKSMRHCASKPPCRRCCSKFSPHAFNKRSRLVLAGNEYQSTRQLCTTAGEK